MARVVFLNSRYAAQRRRQIRSGRRAIVGEKGLVIHLVAQSTIDFFSKNKSLKRAAIDYFYSPDYQEHLEILDLPSHYLPEGVILPPQPENVPK